MARADNSKSFYLLSAVALLNFMYPVGPRLPEDVDYFRKWILKPESREAIHVGERTFDSYKGKVQDYLYDDMFKSVKAWIEDLLNNNYKV